MARNKLILQTTIHKNTSFHNLIFRLTGCTHVPRLWSRFRGREGVGERIREYLDEYILTASKYALTENSRSKILPIFSMNVNFMSHIITFNINESSLIVYNNLSNVSTCDLSNIVLCVQ